MRTSGLFVLAGMAAGFSSALAWAKPPLEPVPASHRPGTYEERPGQVEFSGQLIVRPRQDLSAGDRARALAMLEGRVARSYATVDEFVVECDPAPRSAARGFAENELSLRLMQTGLFQYAVPNWTVYPLATPNDPQYGSQWHHPQIGSPAAWDLFTGTSNYIAAFTDTGIDLTHPDLASKRVPGFNAVDGVAEVNGGQVNDLHGHGTHVAGCGAATGNNGVGVAGVNWNCRIMMVRVSNSSGGGAAYDWLMNGARWAIENGAKSVSTSYSGIDYEPLQTTGAYIRSIGGLYLYAAGNDNRNLSWFDWPDVIVVGASTYGDAKAGFSAYGTAVDVFAPGVDILSSCNGGGYCFASGTSMATPVCNGVVSMIWSANPNLTPEAVETILETTATDLGTPGEDSYWGFGRVNVAAGVQAALASAGPSAPFANADSSVTLANIATTIDVMANDFDANGDSFAISAFAASSAQGGTVARSVGTGPGGRDQLTYTPRANFIGTDTFTYALTDSTGRTSGDATVTVLVEDPALYRAPDAVPHRRPGVKVSYYVTPGYSMLPNFSLLTPYRSDVVPNINFESTGGNYSTSGRADEVGAVYEAVVTAPSTGQYTFYTNSDDGSKLYIGDTLVVNNDGLHGMVEVGGAIRLQAGTHRVRVEFWENFGGAGLITSWAGPGIPKRVIEPGALTREVCAADFNGDGFADFFDYDGFVNAFEAGMPDADFNSDGFIDFFDFDEFVQAFEEGC
jgi:subtilisin family serine protease